MRLGWHEEGVSGIDGLGAGVGGVVGGRGVLWMCRIVFLSYACVD